MIYQISEVLGPAELATISQACERAEFRDGRATAGPGARGVKNNLQAATGEVKGALDMVRDRLGRHPLVRAAALPKKFVRLTVSRYEPGMAYGLHTDNALINGQRTDLSFTLGLDAGTPWAGGELVLSDDSGERSWRVEPGQLLLYPATYLHRVEPVTQGVRLVVVGWITSRVRSAARREILFDLKRSVRCERDQNGKTEQYDRLERVRQNLLRRWAD